MSDTDKTDDQVTTDKTAGDAAAVAGADTDGAEASAAAEIGTGELSALEEAQARIALLEAELAENRDRLMRAAADLQNMRKRAERDRRDAETFGGTKLARDLLPVYDNLSQAIAMASDELREKEAGFFNGVDLTLKELVNGFAKHQITPIAPEKGERFDPHQHQAMFEAPDAEALAGSVIQVMAVGFSIAGKLLRPAMVGVSKGDPAAAGDASASEESKAG